MTRSLTSVPSLAARAACVLLALAAPAAAQDSEPAQDPAARASADGFRARHGDQWRVRHDPASSAPRFAYGSSFEVVQDRPGTDFEWEAAARSAVDQNVDFFGFDSSQLRLEEVRRLALGAHGSSDKVAVQFTQHVNDLPVLAAHVSVLMDAATGRVLALDTTGLPGAERAAPLPDVFVDAAVAAARAAYRDAMGVEARVVGEIEVGVMGPSVTWGLRNPIQSREPTLAYVIELSSPGEASREDVPAQARVYVSAERQPDVFLVEPTAHAAIGGTVQGSANAGPEPNTPTNQETLNLRGLWVRQNGAAGPVLATTDVNGQFTINQNGPLNLFVELRGPHGNVENGGAADSFLLQNGLAGPTAAANFLFNPTKAEFPTAEVAAWHWIQEFRDYVVGLDGNDATMDFPVVASVNNSNVAGYTSCNAVFVGDEIQFLRAAGNCTNTGYRSVFLHEEGHWANERYNGGGGMSGAFHEGNADAWTYFITDDPCLTTFFGSGGCLRSALQTSVKKCASDGNESCNGGESHKEGQALASALWRVRSNLKTALGAAAGAQLADQLFMGWMKAFNDKKILNVIQDHWLALDDDNANLSDLTPHFQQITEGFGAYNWPQVDIPDLTLTAVTAPAENAGVSPFSGTQIVVEADSILGSVTQVLLFHSTNGGVTFSSAPMLPTGQPNRYAAVIPGQPNQTSVRWYVRADGSVGGNTMSLPAAGAKGAHVFHVGQVVQLAMWDFENLSSDQGWTHVGLTGSFADQWERGNPAAPGSLETTDPSGAWSGTRVWGQDLSSTGTDGKYEPNTVSELRAPLMNFAGSSKVILQYRRWLAMESGQFDPVSVRVNGTAVWSSPLGTDSLDGAWTLQEHDISAWAANNPSVQIAFRHQADGALEYGGWNIDDVFLYRVDGAVSGAFTTYGAGCGSQSGVPTLAGTGVPAPGANVTVSIGQAKPNSQGVLLLATGQSSLPLGSGCTLLIGNTLLASLTLPVNGAGALALPAQIPPGTPAVDVYLQFFPLDSGSANGQYTASNGLKMAVK